MIPRKPNPGESRDDYTSFCIKYMIDNKEYPNTEEGRKQAAGHCYSIYDEWKKSKNMIKPERVHLELCADLFKLKGKQNLSDNNMDFERATLIIGDGTYNGMFFPAEELERAYHTWERQPINIDHSEKIEDEVGFIKDIRYDPLTKRVTGQPVINDYMPKANVAKGYMKNRFDAEKYPEGSVGVWIDRFFEDVEGLDEKRLTARNLQGDHYSLVTRGACSPEEGCGIGLSKNDTITISEHISVDNSYYDLADEYNKVEIDLLKEKIKHEKLKGGKK